MNRIIDELVPYSPAWLLNWMQKYLEWKMRRSYRKLAVVWLKLAMSHMGGGNTDIDEVSARLYWMYGELTQEEYKRFLLTYLPDKRGLLKEGIKAWEK